jgi:hypothetical protein
MPVEVRLHAGCHRRVWCPVQFPYHGSEAPVALACQGHTVHAQRDGDELVFFPLPMGPYAEQVYTPTGALPAEAAVTLEDLGDRVRVSINGAELTNYWYKDVPARPYFWPVYADGGTPVTRAFPMRQGVEGETQDHKHHRSLYFAFGSVNGVDNWSEEPGHGFTVHRSIDELLSGPVFGRLGTTSDWTDPSGKKLLEQKVRATFWHISGGFRMMDFDLRLTASNGEVFFGDTKEGGMLTIRVASSMDVPRGGRIETSFGGVDEEEAWGRAAHWCDYAGPVGNKRVGIAVMDHPDSFRYPTYWHIRDYGLFAANPFGLESYTQGAKEGSFLLKAGTSIRFRYRVVIHHGSADDANIRGHYINFTSPPRTEVTTV